MEKCPVQKVHNEWMPGTKALFHLHLCIGKKKGCLLGGEDSNTFDLWSNFNVSHCQTQVPEGLCYVVSMHSRSV